MEKTTGRIDSETELVKFIQKLRMSGIEIPSNVTLEIDSPILKSEIENTTAKWIPQFEVKRIIYMGENITFKSE